MYDTQTKYITVGFIFWLVVLILVIVAMQIYAPKNQPHDGFENIKEATQNNWYVQVASFSDRGHLKKLEARLKKHNYQTHIVFSTNTNGNMIRGLRVGPYQTSSAAKAQVAFVKERFKVEPYILKVEE